MADITLSIDAMGGDHAPDSVVQGCAIALKQHSNLRVHFFGAESRLRALCKKHNLPENRIDFTHTDIAIAADEKPSQALRNGRGSSMGMAIAAVKSGAADGAVSAGNTGALMAIAKIMLRTLPGIDRPAIVTTLPTQGGQSVMLDLGANVHCDANNLFEFALMGDAFARIALHNASPRVALLNIGSEDTKGNEAVKHAATMLEEAGDAIDFIGFVEGDDIAKGMADVIVTDGFTGNVALKVAEGTAKMCKHFTMGALKSNPLGWLAAGFGYLPFKALSKKIDPRRHNGAMFVGLNGIVVKSHGGTDGFGFAHAIEVAYELARDDINAQIEREMAASGHIMLDEEEDAFMQAAAALEQEEVGSASVKGASQEPVPHDD